MTAGRTLEERLIAAEQRIGDLARQKAHLELLNTLLTRLTAVSGLNNMAQHILTILMDTIGANNLYIFYGVEKQWHCTDIHGNETVSAEITDERIIAAIQTRKPQRFHDNQLDGITSSYQTETWVFPLSCADRSIGAVVLEQMILTTHGIMESISPFFVYAALMLDNEINNFSQLEETHRKLKISETLYRTLFEQLPDGVILWELPDLIPVQFNTIAYKQLGYTKDEFAGLTVSDIEVVFDQIKIAELNKQLTSAKRAVFESKHLAKTGETKDVLVSLQQFELGGQDVILDIHHDITEMKRAQEKMALMSYALDNIHESAYLIDENACFNYVNSEACRVHGRTREELTTMSVYDVDPDFPREKWKGHWEHLKEIKSDIFESRHTSTDGTIIPVEINATIFNYAGRDYMLSLVRDISERKQAEIEKKNMERQLLQTQKLESLGILAGGIAHDFNNILMAIMGNAELAKIRIRPESAAIDNLDRIEKAAARAADLAKQMLAYSGKGKFVVENINLNKLLEEMLHLLEVSISKKAILRLNLHDHLPAVKADSTQLRQIIMNLVINASEAIGDKSGVIAITTGYMDCDHSYLKDVWLDENLNDGLYVYLEIADTGCGMDKETLGKLFDPFFTTKFTGRGLGMSAVLGIVRGHHGAIKVYSEVTKGTSFKILLPASDKPAELCNGHNLNGNFHGSGTILLVDDEESVRGIGVEMLKELGYSAITATDGRDALDQFRLHPEISAIILDLTMPRMDGEQCFRELRIMKPDVKVFMSSGYSEQEVSEKFIGKGVAGFIQKPYTLSTLQDVLKKVL